MWLEHIISVFFILDNVQTMMVLQSSLDSLLMTCRGGDHCCARNDVKLCAQDEGDCNSDQDCAGSLVCGDNNCPQSVRRFMMMIIFGHFSQSLREASGTQRMTAAQQDAPPPIHVAI